MRIPPAMSGLVFAATTVFSASLVVAAPPVPGWSSQFGDAGFVLGQFDDGPVCLLSQSTVAGPRLFVGGVFSSVNNPGSAGSPPATLPLKGVALWDGAHWSGIQGNGLPNMYGDGTLRAITTFPVDGVPRVVLAGSFQAPGTGVGIAYLDDALALRPLAPGPISSAWFGGAYGWTPPSQPPPALPATPEIIVTSGIFPQGSEYAYRYTPSAVVSLPPGVITVTNAFAEFDDGTGRALFIGVPMSGAGGTGKLTKWTGTALSSVNPGPISWVNAVCVHDDGGGPALYAAGQGFRRLRGGVWEAVTGTGAPTFNINALASFDDGSGPALYVAGQFTTNVPSGAGTTPAVNIVRLRGDVWEALGTGLTGGVPKAMAVFDEDGPGPRPPGLFVVGKFTTAGGRPSLAIARWGLPVCRADHNGSGGLEVADIFDFVGDWFAGNPRADFNGGGLSTSDVFDFLNAWFAGC